MKEMRLDSARLGGSLLVAALAGLLARSLVAFLVALAAVLALGLLPGWAGQVRPHHGGDAAPGQPLKAGACAGGPPPMVVAGVLASAALCALFFEGGWLVVLAAALALFVAYRVAAPARR